MIDKLIYTGLGTITLLKDKIEEELKVLEKKGKIKTDDAKSLLDSIESKGQEEEEKIKEEIKNILKEAIKDLNIATKDDIEKLKKKIKD